MDFPGSVILKHIGAIFHSVIYPWNNLVLCVSLQESNNSKSFWESASKITGQ